MLRPIIKQVNQVSGWKYKITEIEPIQYTVYNDNNSHYNWHVDVIPNDNTLHLDADPSNNMTGTIRKISCSILLNDPSEYQGGEFELMSANNEPNNDVSEELKGDGYFKTQTLPLPSFKKKGSALFFPSFTFHRVKPITKGTRKSLVCWFRGPKWQ